MNASKPGCCSPSTSDVPASRREFLRAAALLLTGAAVHLAGCGLPMGLDPGPGGVAGAVDDNHLHAALVTRVQLQGAEALLLDIRGESEHPHFLSLSLADLADIRAGKPVSRLSTVDWGHAHMVHFNKRKEG